MDDLMTGLIVGFVAAVVLMALLMFLLNRRLKGRHLDEVRRYDASIVDLRQERAEDKETNRRLRHELVSQSPDRLVETANAASLERDSAVSERDQALEQLSLVQNDLSQAHGRLADREAKLRQYREALKEIRISLEAQDRVRSVQTANRLIDTDTGELPASALGSTQVDGPADVSVDPPPGVPVGADVAADAKLDAKIDVPSALSTDVEVPIDVDAPIEAAADLNRSSVLKSSDNEPADVSAVD